MNVEKLRTAQDWATFYRHRFGLPVVERGGFVMLPITARIGVVHLPTAHARRARTALDEQTHCVPLLARQIRWSFLTRPEKILSRDTLAMLEALDIGVPAMGSALMLPTSMGPHAREGCRWIVPPQLDLPLVSRATVLDAALATAAAPD